MDRKPTHPGILFYEEVMKPLNMSVTDAAARLGVSRKALSELINAKTSLSPAMALRISIATNTKAGSTCSRNTLCGRHIIICRRT